VPHGGSLEYEEIPNRRTGILGSDKNTIELVLDLYQIISELTSKTPSYVIANLRRSKIDFNREEKKAFPANSKSARSIYREYHKKLKELVCYNIETFNYSLLIDFHGFEKHKRPQGFRDVELILGTRNLETLFKNPVFKKDWGNNIRGKIIKEFLKLNINIAPGHPRRKEYVLTGGYIVQQYGASNISKSQSIQIEFSDRIRLYDTDLKQKVLEHLARILCKIFFSTNHNE